MNNTSPMRLNLLKRELGDRMKIEGFLSTGQKCPKIWKRAKEVVITKCTTHQDSFINALLITIYNANCLKGRFMNSPRLFRQILKASVSVLTMREDIITNLLTSIQGLSLSLAQVTLTSNVTNYNFIICQQSFLNSLSFKLNDNLNDYVLELKCHSNQFRESNI